MIAKNLFDIVYNTALTNLSENLGTTVTGAAPTSPAQSTNVPAKPSNFNTISQTISSLSPEEIKKVQTMLNTSTQTPVTPTTGSNVQKPSPSSPTSTVTPGTSSYTTRRV